MERCYPAPLLCFPCTSCTTTVPLGLSPAAAIFKSLSSCRHGYVDRSSIAQCAPSGSLFASSIASQRSATLSDARIWTISDREARWPPGWRTCTRHTRSPPRSPVPSTFRHFGVFTTLGPDPANPRSTSLAQPPFLGSAESDKRWTHALSPGGNVPSRRPFP
eukprot:scaffold2771_cov252-Pinguiococcus_pyrenoidosus.AAC.13